MYQKLYIPLYKARAFVTFSFLSTESSTYMFLHVSVLHRPCLMRHRSFTLSVLDTVVIPPALSE